VNNYEAPENVLKKGILDPGLMMSAISGVRSKGAIKVVPPYLSNVINHAWSHLPAFILLLCEATRRFTIMQPSSNAKPDSMTS
jgi:hypothetical protein